MVLTITTTGEIRQTTKDKIISEFLWMAFGSGSFSGLSTATALGNQVIAVPREEYQELSNSVIISGFLNAAQGNGNTIKEAGARDSETGSFQSGKNITRIEKTSSKELWLDEEVEIAITQEEL